MELSEALAKIASLEDEVQSLKKRLYFLEYNATIAAGMQGEQLVAAAVDGVMTCFTAGADVSIARNGMLLEVKFSNLNVAVKNRENPTKRWTWPRPLGSSGKKIFDRLILVGQADERHVEHYADSEPYVFFDVPFDEVHSLSRMSGTHRNIQITTNPRKAKTDVAVRLYNEFMLPYTELCEKYGLGD
ncbi:MAG: hypothetical protein AAF226_02595 [Verrucomicrobiota bacterium]